MCRTREENARDLQAEEADERNQIIGIEAPAWAWDTIFETLEHDSVSIAFDANLRAEILRAVDATEQVYRAPGEAPQEPAESDLAKAAPTT